MEETFATIVGGRRLDRGSVRISGFKHSLVTIFAAALAAPRPVVIHNCPDITETEVLVAQVTALGGRAGFTCGTLTMDPSGISVPALDSMGLERIHGSDYWVPALLARFGSAQIVSGRGGCQIGNNELGRRPWTHYLDVLERFGATARAADGGITVHADELQAGDIDLMDYTIDHATATGPHYSGASKMAVLTAAVANGTSRLRNLYPKPDVTDLVDFLEASDLGVIRHGPNDVSITGGFPATSVPLHITLTSDLIQVVTYASAAALYCREPLELLVSNPEHVLRALAPEVAALDQLGALLTSDGKSLIASRSGEPCNGVFAAESHGVYSDSLPFLLLLSMSAWGESAFLDTVWPTRFQYLEGLSSLGGEFQQRSAGAWRVRGPCPPVNPDTEIYATELRGAAVLVLAALGVPGTTTVRGIHHLRRGYANFLEDLRGLGADISVGGTEE
jgi:UDP-N-acetylglucosamine 1-carboxyvinyltransferase